VKTRLLFALLLVACGPGASDDGTQGSGSAGGEAASNQNAPPPDSYVVQNAGGGAAPTAAPAIGSGTSREDPLMACGPVDSYRRVAEYRCPDGSTPLNGDPGAGQQAREGNVGPNARGHIIDLYRVPCATGGVELYVDMYGCPEMQGMLGGG